MLHGTWSYIFTSSGTDYCASGSSVDICSSPDTSTIAYNYTACNTVQAYSATGILHCLYYFTSNDYTYLYTYNTDTSTDETTTYRFTCYVMETSNGSIVLATQYPQECASTQTPTSVSSPGASLVYTQTAGCTTDSSSDVLSTAATAGLVIGILLLIIIIVCGVLIWYYYKKRKEKEKLDKMPLQKAQPANKKLVNGGMFRDVKIRQPSRNSKTPHTMTGALTPVFTNGDVKVNIDNDPSIRRENSICISVQSRGGPGFGDLEAERKVGPAPVEEPDQVNDILDDVIVENDNEVTLASTFLPMSPHEKNILNYTDDDIKAIEKKDKMRLEDVDHEVDDMDKIDDELGLPRLSGAFTPIMRPEDIPTLPPVVYKKLEQMNTEDSTDEHTAAGITKVKLKKNKKKKRVTSAKANLKGSPSKSPTKGMLECPKDSTPFLDRIKKTEEEKVQLEQKETAEKELKRAESEMKQARVSLETPATNRSKSPQKAQKTKNQHPVVNTWWTSNEVKAFNQQIKDLTKQRQETIAAASATPRTTTLEKIDGKLLGSDTLWKFKEKLLMTRDKGKGSKKQKISGKKKKGKGAGGEESTLKPSPSRLSKRTLSTTGISPAHPLSLKPEQITQAMV